MGNECEEIAYCVRNRRERDIWRRRVFMLRDFLEGTILLEEFLAKYPEAAEWMEDD